ncbi:extracellular solute-binding protein [Anaerocolumna sedimenticola]|uniref:Extracellular solute-binding protein n=1 Tax=Anaerocolumna sedimenticola TaxID=2696063 RepID=A0A6P1TRX8_9FIRM|nr:extracellular solute-binding protein [Anaerocolumna sedimenticola]
MSDYIRALNTELLAGNGADVLVLDGLPVDSYIEKGVLSDITDIINPLEEAGKVLSNITDYYHKDGKVYEMPLRFSIPVIAGKKEAIKAADNTGNIVKYIEQANIPYCESTSYQALLSDYLALYSGEIFINGKLNEENFTLFLKNIKIIADNIKAEENDVNPINYSKPSRMFFDNLFSGNVVSLGKKVATSTEQVKNIMDTMLLFEVLKDKDFEYKSINQMYIPGSVVGLNSKSRENDIAKKFIGFLFEEKVQNTNLYDGFPVNSGSIKKWAAEENTDLMIGISDADGNQVSAEWPEKEEREAFLNTVLEVKIPIEIDPILINMIVEEAVPYLKGETGEGQVVAAVKAKVNTYLAE